MTAEARREIARKRLEALETEQAAYAAFSAAVERACQTHDDAVAAARMARMDAIDAAADAYREATTGLPR